MFKVNLIKRDISELELLDDLRRVAKLIQKDSVTALIYTEKGKFGTNTFLRRFGSWHNALKAAGLNVVHNVKIPDDDLFENLANVWQHLGRQPFGREMERSNGISKYSLGTYEKRFKSWNNSLIAFEKYINEPNEFAAVNSTLRERKETNKRITSRKINWRLRAIVLIRDNCICRMCGNSPAKDISVVLHVDHITSWSKGGETVLENLQTLCAVCNIGKSDVVTTTID